MTLMDVNYHIFEAVHPLNPSFVHGYWGGHCRPFNPARTPQLLCHTHRLGFGWIMQVQVHLGFIQLPFENVTADNLGVK